MREPTEQEGMLADILMNMRDRFPDTMIKRSNGSEQPFGFYLMDRLFGKATSCNYNSKTKEFTLVFAEERSFNLTKIPEGKSAESLKGLNQLKDSILKMPIQVKGTFDPVKNRINFEPGSLTITWSKARVIKWAQLLGIFETQDETITMQIKTLKGEDFPFILAQDFVDFVECNLPK